MMLPKLGLRSTAGRVVELSELSALRTVIYCYPTTGVPGKPLPENWDAIPGARGRTPRPATFGTIIGTSGSLGHRYSA